MGNQLGEVELYVYFCFWCVELDIIDMCDQWQVYFVVLLGFVQFVRGDEYW